MIHKSKYFYYFSNLKAIFTDKHFSGWGRKRSGHFALWCQQRFGGEVTLYEDGFIRSLGLGVEHAPAFSVVQDTIGMYYDATTPSQLENLLNSDAIHKDNDLLFTSSKAIDIISEYCIDKYNHAPLISVNFYEKYKLEGERNVLVVAQTSGDASLRYGLSADYTTQEMIEDAIRENPKAKVYLKIHPDVLCGKKLSDIKLEEIPKGCKVISEDVNAISLLKYFSLVYTKTSGMGMEALILGKRVKCYGMPFYAGWGLTEDKFVCKRRKRSVTLETLFAAAYIRYTQYFNPYTQRKSDIVDILYTIIKYREIAKLNDGILYFFGFSLWKRKYILPFFSPFQENKIYFCDSLDEMIQKRVVSKSKIYIWGKKPFDEVEHYAKKHNIPLLRVEDGFIRSVSLGSDLTKAYSIVVDTRGIYFDPTTASDFEHIIETYPFDNEILERAKKLQKYLVENKISKYNLYQDKKLLLSKCKIDQKIIMVPGQVEDDASIFYGTEGMNNLKLLQQTREKAKDAYIIYKPHPDVLSGNRKGHIDMKTALRYCNEIITHASIDSVLEVSDEVHTMTSLVGFEALLRGKKVYTYGKPFYAGWGLTNDTIKMQRRDKICSLDILVATALILYPRYIHPKTNHLCEVEVLLSALDKEKKQYNKNILYRMMLNNRNFISRKIQFLLKIVFNK